MSPVRFLVAPLGSLTKTPFFMHKSTVFTDSLHQHWPSLRNQFGQRFFLLVDKWIEVNHREVIDPNMFESTYVVSAGEDAKCLENVQSICNWLHSHQAERSSVLVVMGGGSISDLGGLVAALYKRGMKLIVVPTTLMSMVDAAIGGKNGVNTRAGKNMLGTFYLPDYVITEYRFLKTLPLQEVQSGVVEMFKHALISGGTDWTQLSDRLNPGEIPDIEMIQRSSQIKTQISSLDEKENSARMVLNFGHTVGHALEAYFIHAGQPETHGACVSLGMIVEIRVAIALKFTAADFGEYLIQLIQKGEWSTHTSLPDFKEIAGYLANDKKIKERQIILTAFRSPGDWLFFKLSETHPIELAYQTLKEN